MGVGKEFSLAGRVIRDLAATPWDGKTGNWWDEGTGISQPAVDNMMSRSLRALAGARPTPPHGRQSSNTTTAPSGAATPGMPGRKDRGEDQLQQRLRRLWRCRRQIDQSPQTLLAILHQLVAIAGVPPEMITVYEAARVILIESTSRRMPPSRASVCDSKGDGTNGRFRWSTRRIRSTILSGPQGRPGLPKCVVEATYLVNLTLVKAIDHRRVADRENHYGTVDVRDHEVYVNSHSIPWPRIIRSST